MSNLFTRKFMKVPHIPLMGILREIGRNAFVDWLIIFIVNILVGLTLIVGGLYLFWQISTGRFVVSQTGSKAEEKIFDEKALANIILRFEMREDASRKARGGNGVVGDPSQ
ncbi:MAG: hypothetical protein Q7S72_01665 [Candidatus Taylorbacteria bacterium]|nr:hypothetical protein [Candidatus Taylorbacteria bacterium]